MRGFIYRLRVDDTRYFRTKCVGATGNGSMCVDAKWHLDFQWKRSIETVYPGSEVVIERHTDFNNIRPCDDSCTKHFYIRLKPSEEQAVEAIIEHQKCSPSG